MAEMHLSPTGKLKYRYFSLSNFLIRGWWLGPIATFAIFPALLTISLTFYKMGMDFNPYAFTQWCWGYYWTHDRNNQPEQSEENESGQPTTHKSTASNFIDFFIITGSILLFLAMRSDFDFHKIQNIPFLELRSNKNQATNELLTRDSAQWIFPDSDSRFLERSDLNGLSAEQLWAAKNEIYARNGYIFNTEKGKKYAMSLGSIYKPITKNPKLNNFEKQNIILIQSVLKETE